MEKIVESFIEAEYDQSINAVVSQWLTPPTSEEFRVGMNHLITMLQNSPTGTLLTDTTNLGAINEENQVWSYTEWLENARAAGYDTLVLIMPSDIFAQMSVEDIMEQANAATKNQVVNQYFDNETDARAWIMQRAEEVSQ
ncbi:MAG: hypothetical protein AAF944_01630 [Bacteroidota bacterium]